MTEWLTRHFPLEIFDGGGRCEYMFRWTLRRFARWCPVKGIYLQKIVGDDWSLDLHDHPTRFISIGLWGWYLETCWIPQIDEEITVKWRAPWIRTFVAEHRHRLIVPEPPCWTLCIVFQNRRDWGFWRDGRWTKWDEYVWGPGADAGARRGCE